MMKFIAAEKSHIVGIPPRYRVVWLQYASESRNLYNLISCSKLQPNLGEFQQFDDFIISFENLVVTLSAKTVQNIDAKTINLKRIGGYFSIIFRCRL